MERCLWARTFLRAWVCRPWRRPNESKCPASRCKCQWHPSWSWLCLFVTHSCPQLSAESDFEGPRSDPRSRAFFQEMILVVHFLIFKQETHKWHHVCASRVCSLFCEMKDRLRRKQIHFEFIVIQSRDDVDVVSNGTKSRSCCN